MNDYRLAAALIGRSADFEFASAESIDAGLREFAPGGSKYDRYMAGDPDALAERLSLYRKKYTGDVEID